MSTFLRIPPRTIRTPLTRTTFLPHRTMASSTITSPVGAQISQVAQQEDGPTKGSLSAKMQSQVTGQRNMEQADAEVADKLDSAPQPTTSEDASHAQSTQARPTGVPHPAGGVAQSTQKQTTINEGATSTSSPSYGTPGATSGQGQSGQLDPATQSKLDREANYREVADKVQPKMEQDPGSVTKEEANTLHSREQRAFGTTEKGGLASQAHRLVGENES